MVIIKLFGGLGNQMFQYAFSLGHILQGKAVKYDLSSGTNNRKHAGSDIERVFPAIKLNIARKRDIFYFMESFIGAEGIKEFRLKEDRYFFDETKGYEFTYEPEITQLDNVYFTGYWQNIGYFKKCGHMLKADLAFKALDREESANYELINRITTEESISIHVRRGDYRQSAVHRILSMDYYRKAMDLIGNEHKDPSFFIFSDDKDFAKRHFRGSGMTVIDHNTGADSFRDMHLMSMCSHNIICNSTFSWWAAWLNPNAEKRVIMPQSWFIDDRNISGLLVPGWNII